MSQKESGFIKPIIIGVVTTVMGAVVVSQFDLIKSGTGSGEANTESELTRRQTELEEKIQQLSEQNQPDKSQKNDDMDWGSSFYNLEEEESSYPQARTFPAPGRSRILSERIRSFYGRAATRSPCRNSMRWGISSGTGKALFTDTQ